MAQNLTRQQIYALRGKLKAPQRAAAMRNRYAMQRYKYEIKYQNDLAKRIVERIGTY